MKNQNFVSRFKFAIGGIISAFKSEASFRFQLFAAFFVLLLLFLLRAQPYWWALIIIVIAAVFSAELINTALEHLIDRIHPEKHPAIKMAKDCAAAAVLVLSLASIVVFICFLYERFG